MYAVSWYLSWSQGIDVGEGELGGSQGDSEAWEAELQEMLDMHEPAQD